MRKLKRWRKRHLAQPPELHDEETCRICWAIDLVGHNVLYLVSISLALVSLGLGLVPGFLGGATGLVIGASGVGMVANTSRARKLRGVSVRKPDDEKRERPPIWCSDCGTRTIEFQRQVGFDPRTGAPRQALVWGCPSWDIDAHRHPDAMENELFDENDYVWKFNRCGNTSRTSLRPAVVHNHENEGEVSLECPRCVITMESMGVLTREDATSRLGSLTTSSSTSSQ